ncbi:DUF317 domain-containing protein [Streptomyces stelliscabiei]|uniref:DUF317 domain-containing protein n=1 Tax=Streptomyces stelliscabiei TaxID=146820 RepID=A0A8I0PBX0_9ACTN|nr:DUF317 domain-containing protein [Streptomyces stelliscabiei]KND28601.1 hypothetical protein IQ64_43485 [Streptomyces stelliscabiei]MBE1599879.1 hypothetical protein [Streptomyces stelliscabiei]
MPQCPPHAVPYVLAAPGYLAGGGDWEHLTELLLYGHGWRNVSTIDQHTALASPDGRLHVVLNRRADWTWTLHETSPHGQDWAALLGAHIPVEYLTAMVDAMLQPPSTGHPTVLDPLHAAGWTEQATGPGASAVSPDGLVHFTAEDPAHPGAPRPWRAACTVNGYRWWTAAFSTRTPPGIVTAFTRSLARDDPLPRMAIGTPLYGCGPYTRLTPTPHTHVDEQALLKARIADVRNRRVTGSSPATPPPNRIGRTPATRAR